MAYNYCILTDEQIRLLDEYSGCMHKVKLSQLIDEALCVVRSGVFDYITVNFDADIGRDLTVTRHTYLHDLQVGGGYGDTGVTIDNDGNIYADGVGDFSTSGILTAEYVPPAAASAGEKGMITFGDDAGTYYLFCCVDTNSWQRVALAAW